MPEKEIPEFISRPAEEYWYASRIQRSLEKHLRGMRHGWEGFDDKERDDIFVRYVAKIRQEQPLFWLVIQTDAQRLMRDDVSQKIDNVLNKKEKSLLEKKPEVQFMKAKESLIYNYWEVSQKPPRLLRMLKEELSRNVDQGTKPA
jgi:hypothetical protein